MDDVVVGFRISAVLSCPMKLQKYPLDTQVCPIKIESCEYTRRRFSAMYVYLAVNYFILEVLNAVNTYRARQLYKNISMLFLFPVKRDLLFTNI